MSVTRTLVPIRSAFRFSVNWRTNAFVAPYTLPPGYGYVPAVLPRFTMWPRSRSTIPGSRARVMWISPAMLVATISSQPASDADCAGSMPRASPALLTSTSTSRQPSGRLPGRAATAAASVTSSSTACTAKPSSSARAARRSARRAHAMTRWPSRTNRLAIAAPKPAEAPVTRIVRLMRR